MAEQVEGLDTRTGADSVLVGHADDDNRQCAKGFRELDFDDDGPAFEVGLRLHGGEQTEFVQSTLVCQQRGPMEGLPDASDQVALDGFRGQIAEAGQANLANQDSFEGIRRLRKCGVRCDPDGGDQADTSYRRHFATAITFPMSSVYVTTKEPGDNSYDRTLSREPDGNCPGETGLSDTRSEG